MSGPRNAFHRNAAVYHGCKGEAQCNQNFKTAFKKKNFPSERKSSHLRVIQIIQKQFLGHFEKELKTHKNGGRFK